jgi:hypothetical protein
MFLKANRMIKVFNCIITGIFRNYSFSNSLRLSGNYAPPILTIINAAFCVYRFRIVVTVNGDYFLKQH